MAWVPAVIALALAAAAAGEQTDEQREAQRQVAAATNAFSADLYQALKAQEGNLVVSPFSAVAVLALALQGAGGSTAQQLQAALHLPPDASTQRQGFRHLFASLQSDDEAQVRVANKVYARRGAALREPFRRTAVEDFRAGAEELDFQGDAEGSRRAINAWVEQQTDSKIKDLLKNLSPATLLVLVNAIYFKGYWVVPFNEDETHDEPFHVSATRQEQVPMMHRTAHFGHATLPELSASLLELPYRGNSMRMLVLLPDAVDGLPRVEEGLSGLNLTKITRELRQGEVVVSLPKFKIESDFQLQETLPELGIRDLFLPGANLSGITDQDVLVSQVVQKAFIEVTEKGTTAAASTALVAEGLSAPVFPPPEPVIFNADHPFLLIVANSEDAILFVGRAQRPQIQ